MDIGVIKENIAGEKRVALTPELAKKLLALGFKLKIERNAGLAAGFDNAAYEAAGFSVVDQAQAWQSDLILKVRKPSLEEIALAKEGAVYISFMETCSQKDEIIQAMLAKKMRPFALERIPRISRAQSMDALSSQSNIAGYRAVIEAAAHYHRFFPLMMTSAGSAKPARVVVLGAGVAGLQAIATARRLGAEVYAYDIRPETKEQIQSLGAKAIELDIGEEGSGEGGYAKELSEEAKAKQQQMLADELAKAHVIISTALIPCRPAPVLITEEVVKNMRHGSVIVDLAAANGGNCPLTEADQIVVKQGVTLIGHTNYPSMVAGDASQFLAHNMVNLITIMVEKQDDQPIYKDFSADEITAAALITGE